MIAVITSGEKAATMDSSGKVSDSRWYKTYLFSGESTDLPTSGNIKHGEKAFCFSGTDKGKTFYYDEENSEWVDPTEVPPAE